MCGVAFAGRLLLKIVISFVIMVQMLYFFFLVVGIIYVGGVCGGLVLNKCSWVEILVVSLCSVL